ncbi:MAG TPA: helix-turn-helix domain-containing protein [Rickettsiales bacterium]|nr:helix-turn-helix domain-containing protein [Rickettsiales bacterium]
MEITRENLLALIKNGLAQNKLSISALERQAGVPKDTVRDFLRGKTQVLRADKLQKIMRVLQPEEKIHISGEAGRDAEIFPISPSASGALECPPGFSPSDVAAVRVTSDAMLPVFHEGWIIYYSSKAGSSTTEPVEGWQVPYNKTGTGPYSEFLGKPCVVKLTDGRVFLRTLKAGSEPGRYNLIAYNASDITNVEVAWAAKIVFIKT